MLKPDTILRFYKPNAGNIECLGKHYIYFFSARQWKDEHEMQFGVDSNDTAALKQYVTDEIERAFSFAKGSDEYNRYFGYRHDLLSRHGRINLLATGQEKDHLVELSLKELSSEKIKESKQGLVRNNFFSKTGISCFTADRNMLGNRFHWSVFAGAGEGFCVEYDWPLLESHFQENKAGVRGDYVKYYEGLKPQLILQSGYSEKVMDNYCNIIFSLSQLMQDENEFRLAKVFTVDMPDQDDRRKEPIPPNAIKTIFLGPKTTGPYRQKLSDIVKSALPATRLMMIEESDGKYKTIDIPAT